MTLNYSQSFKKLKTKPSFDVYLVNYEDVSFDVYFIKTNH